jgi:regulator of sigma E protease
LPAQAEYVLQIEEFESFSTMDDYGLRVGDEIIELDGEKMYVYNDFSMILSLNPGEKHEIVVLRDGEKVVFKDFIMETHPTLDEDGNEVQRYGVTFGTRELNLGGKLRLAWFTVVDWVRSVRLSLQMLISGQVGFSQMSGPVGIVNQMGEVAENSATWVDALLNMLYFGAFIAINLSVMNLLPIPALDGGRVVALLLTTGIEAVTKKKINPKYEGYIHAAGMILLLGLMALIMFKDIFTIFKG